MGPKQGVGVPGRRWIDQWTSSRSPGGRRQHVRVPRSLNGYASAAARGASLGRAAIAVQVGDCAPIDLGASLRGHGIWAAAFNDDLSHLFLRGGHEPVSGSCLGKRGSRTSRGPGRSTNSKIASSRCTTMHGHPGIAHRPCSISGKWPSCRCWTMGLPAVECPRRLLWQQRQCVRPWFANSGKRMANASPGFSSACACGAGGTSGHLVR